MASSDGQKHLDSILGEMIDVTGACDTHGDWIQRVPSFMANRAKGHCPSCAEDRRRKESEAEDERRRQAETQRRIAALEKRGVCLRHLDKRFDSYIVDNEEQRSALSACRTFAEAAASGAKRIPSLILSGGPGTGKTHLTCAVVQHCYDAGIDAHKTNVIQIVRDIKSTWRKDSKHGEEDIIGWYAGKDVLVIDEIGVQFGSDTERMYVFEIINRRYEDCLPTILVTNLDVNGLRAEVGERVLDRLREDGGRMLVFTGKSWRAS